MCAKTANGVRKLLYTAVYIIVTAHLQPLLFVLDFKTASESYLFEKLCKSLVNGANAVDRCIGSIVEELDYLIVIIYAVNNNLTCICKIEYGSLGERSLVTHKVCKKKGPSTVPTW